MLVLRKRSDDPSVVRFRPRSTLPRRLARRWKRWRIARDHARYEESSPAWREPFHGDRSRYGREVVEALPAADVVNLHWVSRFLDYRAFFEHLDAGTPVVWTLHDMNTFTGGCHYDHGCGAYRDRCGCCPQLGSSDDHDFSREVWQRKDDVFRAVEPGRLHFVSPSEWLAEAASESSLLGGGRFPVSVVPYGVDTDAFAPRDRTFARRVLDLPQDADIALFVAHSVENHRKGFDVLEEALEGLAGESGLLSLTLGKGSPELPPGIEHRHLGFVSEDRYLSIVYSAADVFVIPSRQDNLPATVLEALACGTPVVGSRVGGVPDMVRPGETGALAAVGDPGELRESIREVLGMDQERRRELSERCRKAVLREYTLCTQARRYETLYRNLDAFSPGAGGSP